MTPTDPPTEPPRAAHGPSEPLPRQRTWFDEQLATAGRRTATWPDWARREAGLPVAEEPPLATHSPPEYLPPISTQERLELLDRKMDTLIEMVRGLLMRGERAEEQDR